MAIKGKVEATYGVKVVMRRPEGTDEDIKAPTLEQIESAIKTALGDVFELAVNVTAERTDI